MIKNLLIASIMFGLGMIIGLSIPDSTPIVEVLVKNDSGQDIEVVYVTHENGISLLEGLAKEESKKVHFYSSGETSYFLKVTFKDGRKLASKERYAEADYKIVEMIKDSEIESIFKLD